MEHKVRWEQPLTILLLEICFSSQIFIVLLSIKITKWKVNLENATCKIPLLVPYQLTLKYF